MVSGVSGWVLDPRAIFLFATGHPHARGVVWDAMDTGYSLAVPSAALAHAYAVTPAHDHDAIGVLRRLPIVVIDHLDAVRAEDVGRLLAGADQPEVLVQRPDALALAHTALLYRLRDWPVVTDDLASLLAVDPRVEVRRLPPV
ncbi:hypothetical protein SUDANB95_07980 (plasmid) [Actinosynnema sp. ALI-1.44]